VPLQNGVLQEALLNAMDAKMLLDNGREQTVQVSVGTLVVE